MNYKVAGLAVAAIVSLGFRDSPGPENAGALPFNLEAAKRHFIPLSEAAGYTRHFRETRKALHAEHPGMKARLALETSESFNRDAIAALLNAKDAHGNPAAGVRIYQGLDAAGQTRLVLVPYDARGNDILTKLSPPGDVAVSAGTAASLNATEVVEDGQRCPPIARTMRTRSTRTEPGSRPVAANQRSDGTSIRNCSSCRTWRCWACVRQGARGAIRALRPGGPPYGLVPAAW